jgi:hypothetical protein
LTCAFVGRIALNNSAATSEEMENSAFKASQLIIQRLILPQCATYLSTAAATEFVHSFIYSSYWTLLIMNERLSY